MKNYNDWAQLVAKNLQGEADFIAAIEKDEIDDDGARAAFITAVLEPFLPECYGIGPGRIVDAKGVYSSHFDIVIYHRDFPRIGLKSTQPVYLYESVLAAFEIRGKLLRKSLLSAMDACASLAELQPNIDKPIHDVLAKKKDLKLNKHGQYEHSDPMRTQRFGLIARPPTFVFGFTGIKNSHKQLKESIEVWLQHQYEHGVPVELKSVPAVIATQGCFAWRNAAPLALKPNKLLGLGSDSAPVRLIIMQLLHLLNRRLTGTTDSFGFKPNLNTYIKQMAHPVFDDAVGRLEGNPPPAAVQKASKPAQETKPAEVKPDPAAAQPAVETKPAQAPAEAKPAPATPAPVPAAVQTPSEAVQETKPAELKPEPAPAEPAAAAQPAPAPTAAAPAPAAPAPAPVAAATAAQEPEKPKMQTLNSAVPSMSEGAETVSDVSEPEFLDDEELAAQEDVVTPINTMPGSNELEFPKLEDPDDSKESEFERTMVMEKPVEPESESASPAKTNGQTAPATATAAAPAAAEDDNGEGEFEQTLVMQAPAFQEEENASKEASAADKIAEKAAQPSAVNEPFPHLAPEKAEEPEPFTTTIPQ